jgi:hemoglobin
MELNMENADEKTPLERLGGKDKLREIVGDFYQRVVADPMIGFMFKSVHMEALMEREYEFSAVLLGAKDVPYRGRGMRQAHAAHRVMGGQFARRQKLLQETLSAHAISPEIIAAWLQHNESMRPQITSDTDRHCGGSPMPPSTGRRGDLMRGNGDLMPLKGDLRPAQELPADVFFPAGGDPP